MPHRVALLGCSHETNTFSPIPTTYQDFANGNLWRGVGLEGTFGESSSVMAGYFQAAREYAFDAIPLMFTRAEPLGIITADAAQRIAAELLGLLRENGPWDGVLLTLHGAAVTELEADFDGWILQCVRQAVGKEVSIGVVYDLHANVSSRMIEACDIAVFYRTNPHLDAAERGLECGRLLARTMNGEIRPTQALVKPPVIIGITRSDTSEEPMRGLLNELRESLLIPGMLSASIVEGFPWADVNDMGMAFVAVSDNDPNLARQEANRLARNAWHRRYDMISEALPPERAIREACSAGTFPVGILDIGDNIGGGGAGESTILLGLAMQAGLSDVLLSLFDPRAVDACVAAGIGATLSLSIGAKLDDSFCQPLHVTGRVRLITDGKFEDTHSTHEGYRFFDTGPTVALELDQGITVVLTSRRVGNVSQVQFRCMDIDLAAKKLIILKGVNAPRAAFGNICSDLILADTPGATSANLSSFSYDNRRQPLFPFEVEADF